MSDALWAARLVIASGTPPTLLDTETIRAICVLADEQDKRIVELEAKLAMDETAKRVRMRQEGHYER